MANAKLKSVAKVAKGGSAAAKAAKPKPVTQSRQVAKIAPGKKAKAASPKPKPRAAALASKGKSITKPPGKVKPAAKVVAKGGKASKAKAAKPPVKTAAKGAASNAKAKAVANTAAKGKAKVANKTKAPAKPAAVAKGKVKVAAKAVTKITSKVAKVAAKQTPKPVAKKPVKPVIVEKAAIKSIAKPVAKPRALVNAPVTPPTGKQPVVPTKVTVKPVVVANKTIVVDKPRKGDAVADLAKPAKPIKPTKAEAIAAAKKNMAAVLAAQSAPVKTGKPGRPPKNAVDAPEAASAEAAAPVAIAINPLTGKPKTRKQLLLEKKQQALLEALAPFKTVDAETRRLRLKTLITLGKDRGYLTYSEINDHLPDDLVDAEAIESIVAMINDMGIQVFDEAPAAEELIISETASAVADDDVAEEAEQAISQLDSEFGRTTDPVRMYMREMGTVELLTREGEIEIAMRIEDGLKHMVQAISACPMSIAQILELADKIEKGEAIVDDIVDGLAGLEPPAPAPAAPIVAADAEGDEEEQEEEEEDEEATAAISAELLAKL